MGSSRTSTSCDATVFVVDDDPGIRNALTRLFHAAHLRTVAFASAREFLDTYEREHFGCLILDVRMPGMNGLELQVELNARNIRIPVIFLTGSADVGIAVAAMRAGASDLIEKPFDNAMLVERTRTALELGVELRRAEVSRADVQARIARLTPREREVMALMLAGKLSKQIAHEFGTSVRTVDTQRAQVMQKMQADGLAGLVRMTQQMSE